ncbi:hypothetical protein [Magnetospirillum sp. 64-120]|nr:hypothetical protein [Magnetospirillum sp. 64-120]
MAEILRDMLSETVPEWLARSFLRLLVMVVLVGLAYLVWLVFPDSPFR